MPIVVRRPTLRDVDRLAVINVETWRVAYAGIVPAAQLDGLTLDTYRDRWRANLVQGSSGALFLVAEVDNVLSSYAIVGPYRPPQSSTPTNGAPWRSSGSRSHPGRREPGRQPSMRRSARDSSRLSG